ncbi:MerR family transcriptional regulator [Commensalibacter papalotli (ex Botero et al. 2024)]|uniref:MerR family (SoxR) (PDB:2VZ4) n=1 Tax=Commensalibacter papalotli (ex Botero et al. 2024) TaxID=2972766 RepID=A0ABN8WBD9_9PROT|nr:MerR family transcriptional regulator [Commensalibacter papalotli (ex Botero et al. 2024)]CAI3930668.1 DNA-binding transcriptional regulator [Commensalibacter papalotli (ex Botero et al. 2024)]CAI3945011.1 DNA-binding transcriptional regulator [Commensalibacter papalotli (ex Botero et al. 2024)]
MTNSTSTVSSSEVEEEFLDNIEDNSDIEAEGVTKKHPGAFRTISEVAEEIHVPQHVLRFWETRFKQVQPVKRSGGRRYYRTEDISLLQYISELLYTQGYTIKGVQRLLEEDFSKFNTKKTDIDLELQNENDIDVSSSIASQEMPPEQSEEADMNDEKLSPKSVANTLEVTRLKEENKLLIYSLKTILSELQELRKIIAAEC